jgi:hypothetical protein
MVLFGAVTICDRDCRILGLSVNQLTGTIPKSLLAMKVVYGLDMSYNLLTGNATLFVDTFGDKSFQNNCFDPSVPPSNPSC